MHRHHLKEFPRGFAAIAALALCLCAGTALATQEAPADTSMALEGSSDGTVFKSLTVEGENRVRITFERPELAIDLDPSEAPGLTWGTSMDVLNRTVPDLTTPLLASSAHAVSPTQVRPWLSAYQSGPVATFTFDMEKVHSWKLQIVDSRGTEVARFEGKKNPPRRFEWDGQQLDGTMALPGLTYSYVLEAFDKAGNRRRFVGEGFQPEAYRLETKAGPEFLISGSQWREAGKSSPTGDSAFLLETASRINLRTSDDDPVVVTATAGSYAEAMALGDLVAGELRPYLPGSDGRVAVTAVAVPGSPPGGILHIRSGSSE